MRTSVRLPTHRFPPGLDLPGLGSGLSARLIVSGTHRGRLVYFSYNYDLEALVPHYFVRPGNFLAWYGRWLDELLAGFEDVWTGYGTSFGYGVGGSEADQVARLDRADASDEERREALAHLERRRYRDLDDPRNHSRFRELEPETLAAVRRHIDHDAPSVRTRALRVLLIHNDPRIDDDLLRAIHDTDPKVRVFALSPLARRPIDPPWDVIRQCLDDPSVEVIRRAVSVLGQEKQLAPEEVRRFLVHPDPGVRDRALWVAIHLPPDPGNVGPVLGFLANSDPFYRYLAVVELGRLGDPAAVPALIEIAAGNDELELIDGAIAALGMIGDQRATPTLMRLAAHTDPFVRHRAAGALGQLGDRTAIPSLRALLADDCHPPRRNAEMENGTPTATSIADVAREALRQLGEA